MTDDLWRLRDPAQPCEHNQTEPHFHKEASPGEELLLLCPGGREVVLRRVDVGEAGSQRMIDSSQVGDLWMLEVG